MLGILLRHRLLSTSFVAHKRKPGLGQVLKSENEFLLQGPPELKLSPAAAPVPSKQSIPPRNKPRNSDKHLPLCLKLFYQPDPSRVTSCLEKAWKEDSLTTLKLIFHLRVRGTGDSDKTCFYDAACWLHKHHPQTLAANISNVVRIGYFKDLLELLLRILEGGNETRKRLALKSTQGKKAKVHAACQTVYEKPYISKKEVTAKLRRRRHAPPGTVRIAVSIASDRRQKKEAAALRRKRRLFVASRAVERHRNDSSFRTLYNSVVKLFSDSLAKDLKALEADGETAGLSLAAKWCPSLDSSYDRQTLICEAVACRLFPKASEYQQLKHAHYVYRVRDRLRKKVLVPLRKALELPEVFMTAQRWSELPYDKVGQAAMRSYAKHFRRHDGERFKVHVENAAENKLLAAPAEATELLPHEILARVVQNIDGNLSEDAEAQWNEMLESLKQKRSFPSCLALSSLKNDSKGLLMEISIALRLLTSELNEEPWTRCVGSFGEGPKLRHVAGKTLRDKYRFLRKLPRGVTADFQQLFDRILARGTTFKVPSEKMLKQVLVLGNLDFISSSFFRQPEERDTEEAEDQEPWDTQYRVICKKFQDAGYGNPPQLTYWNFGHFKSIPVVTERPGLVLVSGYSRKLLKILLHCGRLDPMIVMRDTISSEIYSDLVLMD